MAQDRDDGIGTHYNRNHQCIQSILANDAMDCVVSILWVIHNFNNGASMYKDVKPHIPTLRSIIVQCSLTCLAKCI